MERNLRSTRKHKPELVKDEATQPKQRKKTNSQDSDKKTKIAKKGNQVTLENESEKSPVHVKDLIKQKTNKKTKDVKENSNKPEKNNSKNNTSDMQLSKSKKAAKTKKTVKNETMETEVETKGESGDVSTTDRTRGTSKYVGAHTSIAGNNEVIAYFVQTFLEIYSLSTSLMIKLGYFLLRSDDN